MTTFKRTTYVGEYPVCTNQPIMTTGGFTLDTEKTNFSPGDIIPAGTLVSYNEITRKARILKTGKVKAVSDDKTVFTLETNEHRPLFATGDVIETHRGYYGITNVEASKENVSITLEQANHDLQPGDIIASGIKGIEDEEDAKAYVPTALVIADTTVTDSPEQTGIDISTDSGSGAWYLRRIPPVPKNLIENNLLKTNPNIKFTQSS